MNPVDGMNASRSTALQRSGRGLDWLKAAADGPRTWVISATPGFNPVAKAPHIYIYIYTTSGQLCRSFDSRELVCHGQCDEQTAVLDVLSYTLAEFAGSCCGLIKPSAIQ